jgi:hypothetical protein
MERSKAYFEKVNPNLGEIANQESSFEITRLGRLARLKQHGSC